VTQPIPGRTGRDGFFPTGNDYNVAAVLWWHWLVIGLILIALEMAACSSFAVRC
jgi:hypothetical protein